MRWLVAPLLVVGQLAGATVSSAEADGPPPPAPESLVVEEGPPSSRETLVAEEGPPSSRETLVAEEGPPSSPGTLVGLMASVLVGVREAASDRSETTLWGWPLAGTPRIVRGFDPPEQRWLPGHRGIDLAGVSGERVLAVDDGVVTFSGEVAGTGVVSVTHASGLRSTYQPVSDRVDRGDRVRRGDPLGRLAAAGGHCSLRVCLHLGALRGRDSYVDPTPLLLGADLALLPVEQ